MIKIYKRPDENNVEIGDYLIYRDPEEKNKKILIKYYEILDKDEELIYFGDEILLFQIPYSKAIVIKEDTEEILVGEDTEIDEGFSVLEKILFAEVRTQEPQTILT